MNEDEKILKYINDVREKYNMPLWNNLGQFEDDRGRRLSSSERKVFLKAISNE